MVKTDGKWQRFASKAEMEAASKEYDVWRWEFTEPGWYYVTTGSQRCPRNCCYDSVIKMVKADDRAREVAEGMTQLAGELRGAREKALLS